MKKALANSPCLALVLLLTLWGCSAGRARTSNSAASGYPSYSSYREIPGVTEAEINAIEDVKERYSFFTYGSVLTSEAFYGNYEVIQGYTARLCQWLTGLFGIPFIPRLYPWEELLHRVNAKEVDFTGDLSPSEERRKQYLMTDPIAERVYKSFRIRGKSDWFVSEEMEALENPRYGFLQDTLSLELIPPLFGGTVAHLKDYEEAYTLLQNGEIDVFFAEDVAEAVFDQYPDVVAEYFFPQIHSPVSLSTAIAELSPLISVVQKYLEQGGYDYLAELYTLGRRDYLGYKFLSRLTSEEKQYVQDHQNPEGSIKVGFQYDNYPISFFNEREKQWQGIAPDMLEAISALTGLRFVITNKETDHRSVLINKLERGEVSMLGDLIYSRDRASAFIWAESYLQDRYVLLSRTNFPEITLSKLINERVGMVHETIYTQIFKEWFPKHRKYQTYPTFMEAFAALEKGEINLLMGSGNVLLMFTNYYEGVGFKINYIFEQPCNAYFGFNKGETTLRSIINKAQPLIPTAMITDVWSHRVFDYREKMNRARIPYIIAVLVLIILGLVFIILIRNRIMKQYLVDAVNERTEIMLEMIPICCSLWDENFNFIDCNEEAVAFFGLHNKEELGKRFYELSPEYQPDGKFSAQFPGKFIAARDQGRIQFEWMHQKLDGTLMPCDIVLVRAKQGNHYIFTIYNWDLREQKQMETNLIQARSQALAASQAKSQFLASMSHEIRTPMNAIIGMSEIMPTDNLNQTQRHYFNDIRQMAKSLLQIINDILDFSKIEAGKMELVPLDFNFLSLFDNICSMSIFIARAKDLAFRFHFDPNIPEILYGDQGRIRQVILNIVNNAIKYTKEGYVSFKLDRVQREGKDWVCCTVEDSGIGIKKENFSKVFGTFEQFDREKNAGILGTGLGLSIVKRLLDMMGGEIRFDSEYGKGTVFTVYFPLVEGDRSKVEQAGTKGQVLAKEDEEVKVLVVDDNSINLNVATGFLATHRITADTAMSGQTAIEMVKEKQYDLVFMDHMMPGMDGVEATRGIRNLSGAWFKSMPIVALSANAVSGARETFLAAGMNDFIPKPIMAEDLNAMLQKWLPGNKIIIAVEAGKQSRYSDAGSEPVDSSPERDPDLLLAELANIEGLDTTVGLSHVGDNIPAYRDILRQFCMEFDGYIEEIRRYLAAEDWKNYSIKLHAMKGVLATIGIDALSKWAYKLELASKGGDADTCKKETEDICAALYEFKEKLRSIGLMNKEEPMEKVVVEAGELKEWLEEMKNACLTGDSDKGNVIAQELKQMSFNKETDEALEKICVLAESLDYEEVIQKIAELQAALL